MFLPMTFAKDNQFDADIRHSPPTKLHLQVN
jgi:hypothetical protein